MSDFLYRARAEEAFDADGPDELSFVQGSILEVSTDALVSPANSFGYMDGGLDLLLSEHFGCIYAFHLQHIFR